MTPGPVQTVLLLSLFKTKVSDQDGLKLSDSESSSLEKGEKQRKFKTEATNRFAVISPFFKNSIYCPMIAES